MDAATLWGQALPLMKKTFTDVVFNVDIKTLEPISFNNNTITLMTTDFNKPTILKRHLNDILRCINAYGTDIDVKIVSPEDFSEKSNNNSENIFSSKNYENTNLKRRYNFNTFVEGRCNQMAYTYSVAVAKSPGIEGYNPLFLYGTSGLGKTHLIQSIGNYAFQQNPNSRIIYTSTEAFSSELITAMREHNTVELKRKYQGCDMLLIDDIQSLADSEAAQDLVFNILDVLYNSNKQIVLTSDQPPRDISNLALRLTTRFVMGLTADLSMPDYETRSAILEKKLSAERLDIPFEVKELITRKIVSNVRELEGALNRIIAYSRLTETPVTLQLAEEALKELLVSGEKPVINVNYIQEVVSSHFGLTIADLIGTKRSRNIVVPRQIAMYLSRKFLDLSLPSVGKHFGGRDHSTVIHSCAKITFDLENDPAMRNTVYELERKIRGE